MVSHNKRFDLLINMFWHHVNIEMNLPYFSDYFDYPAVNFVTFKMAGKKNSEAAAYCRRVVRARRDNKLPLYKIYFIREATEPLSDQEFLYFLAHEASHALINSDNKYGHTNELEEMACDVLAEHFFGFPKPKGSRVGYLLDKTALRSLKQVEEK